MRAKEFILEYLTYTPHKKDPDTEMDPLEAAAARVNYMIKKGEAIDFEHALKAVSNEVACELEMDPVEVSHRIKGIM